MTNSPFLVEELVSASIVYALTFLCASITAGICRLEQLQELRLSRNRFEGEIPLCFSRFSKLRVLDLSSNHLSGKIPYFISDFKSMEYLSLLDNDFEGLFSLGLITELTELKVFKLSSRSGMLQIVETNVSGGLQSQLSSIMLSHCNLGKIPGFLWYQQELRVIDLSNNILSCSPLGCWKITQSFRPCCYRTTHSKHLHFQEPCAGCRFWIFR